MDDGEVWLTTAAQRDRERENIILHIASFREYHNQSTVAPELILLLYHSKVEKSGVKKIVS